MPSPTDEQLLAFEAQHPRNGGRKETAIRQQLGLDPARYFQLLRRLTWSEEALQIDPMLTNRLRRQSLNRQLEQQHRNSGR